MLDFVRKRAVTSQSLVAMVRAYPRYFEAIRPNMLRLTNSAEIQSVLVAGFQRMKTLYPNAIFPPVTFLVGRFSTGGTTSLNGMLIGAEFCARDANTPMDELGTFQRNNVHGIDTLPLIVAHEHVHILQANANGLFNHSSGSLLDQSLIEGSADFIASLVSGGNINAHIFPYALAHEAELWAEFKPAMNGNNVSAWLYNQGDVSGERPGDLGYFAGYRIAESYYARAVDKVAAVRDIIEMRNSTSFLQQSGYAPVLAR